MRLVRAAADGVAENLALDEALLAEGVETLRFWECTDPVVVLGRSGRLPDQVHVDACEADRVPVVRRSSGGGAVVLAAGCLNYSLVFRLDQRPEWRDVRLSVRQILGVLARELAADFREPSDLAVQDRKISGCAQRRTAHTLLHHGTLLYAFDSRLAERYLREPERQPSYRRGRSHTAFLGNLPLEAGLIRDRVAAAWLEPEAAVRPGGNVS